DRVDPMDLPSQTLTIKTGQCIAQSVCTGRRLTQENPPCLLALPPPIMSLKGIQTPQPQYKQEQDTPVDRPSRNRRMMTGILKRIHRGGKVIDPLQIPEKPPQHLFLSFLHPPPIPVR
ncbi:MAG: hypothetical protein QXY90_06980, partial [Candidatus Anstonellales archaeon]